MFAMLFFLYSTVARGHLKNFPHYIAFDSKFTKSVTCCVSFGMFSLGCPSA